VEATNIIYNLFLFFLKKKTNSRGHRNCGSHRGGCLNYVVAHGGRQIYVASTGDWPPPPDLHDSHHAY